MELTIFLLFVAFNLACVAKTIADDRNFYINYKKTHGDRHESK